MTTASLATTVLARLVIVKTVVLTTLAYNIRTTCTVIQNGKTMLSQVLCSTTVNILQRYG